VTKARDLASNAQGSKPTIVDAKGDIIVATAADTVDRLAVGSNGDALVADSTTSTGLRWQPSQAAGKNAIINGAFDVWQRGTSISVSASSKTYTADRWWAFQGGGTSTVSRQTTDLTAFQYGLRYQRNSGQTATNGLFIQSPVETINAIPYAGKQVTFSFYAKRGANYSASSNLLNVVFQAGTGTDQDGYGGYTGNVGYVDTTVTLTTSYQRFSYTFTIGATITEFQPVFYYTPTGTAGANDWFEITGVQVEVGAVATTFTRAGGTIQGELAACQRYYYLLGNGNTATNRSICSAAAYASNDASGVVQFPVTMRTTPTLTASSGTNYYGFLRDSATDGFNSFTLGYADTTSAIIYNASQISSTAGHGGIFITQSASASVAFGAEL